MAYSDKLMDHYENPRNVGAFDKGDDSVGTGMVGAPACGDVMKLQIKVNEQGVIEDILPLNGTISVQTEKQHYVANTGESIRFHADQAHRYLNHSNQDVIFYNIIHYAK